MVQRGLPPRAAVPRRGPDRPRPRHRDDRHDRREHPRPPLRPLRARGGAVTDAGRATGRRGADDPADGRLRYRRILLKLSGEALLGERQYGVDPAFCAFIARQVAEVHATGVEVGIVVGGGNIFRGLAAAAPRDGPRDRRLHRHARDRHERPRAPGRDRAGRRPGPGHERDRDERDRRAVHPAARRAPPREGPRRRSSSPAPATRTSRPTPRRRCARSRSAPRSCSRRPRSTASTTRTR